jgi:2-amino-4-hydroxy-6-hydroxymethyldihydropteridine diphosphokinase
VRWRPAYVGLGSNLAEPEQRVRAALAGLARLDETTLVAQSRLWRSRPMGPVAQPDYVNAVAGLLTRLEASDLLAALKVLERALGREEPVVRWGPRVIDLDLLMLGNDVHDAPGLQLPHQGMHERDFVLYPLAEFAPTLWIPGRGRVARLLSDARGGGLSPLPQ